MSTFSVSPTFLWGTISYYNFVKHTQKVWLRRISDNRTQTTCFPLPMMIRVLGGFVGIDRPNWWMKFIGRNTRVDTPHGAHPRMFVFSSIICKCTIKWIWSGIMINSSIWAWGWRIGMYLIFSSTNLPTDDNTITPERISPKKCWRPLVLIVT